MSWQCYIDNLMGTKYISSCGIFGLDGVTWASNMPAISADIIKSMASDIASGSSANQSIIGGEHYVMVRCVQDSFLILKKVQKGIVVSKAKTCLIIAFHNESCKAETVLTALGKVTDYLTKNGY